MSNNNDYRKRTQRKGMITTIIAGVVIVGAVIAIIVAIIALSSKDSTADQNADTGATTAQSASEPGATQPTLYRGDSTTSTQPVPTTTAPTTAPSATEKPATPATQAPTGAPDTPIDPGAAETPTEAPDTTPDNSGTGAIRSEAPVNTYTDDSGVLHIFTPAGYNWTYQCDGSHVTISCDVHDDRFEFLVTGIAPGSEDIIPQYFVNADKSAWVRVPVTVNVDENLRVTVG